MKRCKDCKWYEKLTKGRYPTYNCIKGQFQNCTIKVYGDTSFYTRKWWKVWRPE